MALSFSQRSAFERSDNPLERARSAVRAAGGALLDLSESNPTRAGLPVSSKALAALADPAGAEYHPEPFGLLSARTALSAFMAARGKRVAPEHILLTASTSEAYAFLFKLLCDPGDEVLVPSPSYPLFDHLLQLEGLRPVRYPLAYDGRFYLDPRAFEHARGPRARAVVIVHPNNPTGSYLKRDELSLIEQLDLPIISDEVFASYPLSSDQERVPSLLDSHGKLVFTLHGLSKLAALPQLKLAWTCVSGRAELVREACARLELIADSFLSVGTPVQLALPAILETHGEVADAIRARLRANLDLLASRARGTEVTPLHVEGGWYAVVRVPSFLDDETWAIELLRATSVLVQPGYFYDFEGGPYLVLSLLTREDVFEEGVRRLLAHVRERSAPSR